jgi:hypothetical protein
MNVKKLAGLHYMLIVSDRLASQTLLEMPTTLLIEKNRMLSSNQLQFPHCKMNQSE